MRLVMDSLPHRVIVTAIYANPFPNETAKTIIKKFLAAFQKILQRISVHRTLDGFESHRRDGVVFQEDGKAYAESLR